MLRRGAVVAGVVLGVVAVVLGAVWALQRFLIYLPSPGPVPPAAQVISGARDVRIPTEDGLDLGAWYVPAQPPDLGVTVLVLPGNGGNRSGRAPLAEALSRRGLGVLLLDYRGYGGNPGTPSEDGLAADARAAQRYLVERLRVPPDRLIYFGESLGAAVATRLAVERPPGGLLLRSPFEDLAAAGAANYPFLPVRALLRERYPVVELVRQVRVPVTVVYAGDDSIVPPEQSRAVAAAAPDLRQLVEVRGADHNDPVLFDGPQVVDAVLDLARLRS